MERGTLDDLDILRKAAAASDGVIHLAFKHDIAFSGGFQGAADADRRAVETFGEVLAGSDRPFVLASGTLGLSLGRPVTERDGHGAERRGPRLAGVPQIRMGKPSWRSPSLRAASARQSSDSLRRITARATTASWPTIVGVARDKGASGYIGDGTNRWPAVHRLDSAHLFRLAVEYAPAGSTLHAVADEGVPISDIAEVMGRHLDVPVVSIPPKRQVSTSPGWGASSGSTARPRAR